MDDQDELTHETTTSTASMINRNHGLTALIGLTVLATVVYASTGDRNPTFQQCLKGCRITYCDPSQPPIPAYLRAFGWTCEDNCRYECGHAFTDMVRTGSRYHQFYGKWAFYRLGPIQEPFSVLMSLGNFWAHWQGFKEVRRRVSGDNKMKKWLIALALIQMNTWIWSTVFHTRDMPITERFDYFSATVTIASSLLFTIARTWLLQTPNKTSRLLLPVSAGVVFIVYSHFTYLLSFSLGQFPYGYHTKFNVALGMIHNLLWILWSLRFVVRFPKMHVGTKYTFEYPLPYPPRNPLDRPRQRDGMTPLALVVVMTVAMSLELLDFAPVARVIDAHSLWHAATIPIALGWWTFLCNDAVEFEGAVMGKPATIVDEVAPLLNGSGRQAVSQPEPVVPPVKTPDYITIAANQAGSSSRPRGSIVKEDRQD